MGHRSSFSAQTRAVLAELCATPSQWRHGYGLARATGLKSGTLYPVLVRLADRGLVEACWEVVTPQRDLLAGSGMFGHEQRVAPDADRQTQLLAILGREA